jgi:CRISPR-associated protein Cmr2
MQERSQAHSPDHIARARLAARLHDPPEKALILMRTREGHEAGTSRTLLSEIFPDGLTAELSAAVTRADHWASAADRAAFPNEEGESRWPAWQQVRFSERPVLIHPLTGVAHALQQIGRDIDPAAAQALATSHLQGLVHRDGDRVDAVRTALAFWRFGSELPGDLANLWGLLPADSRVPDHTIHDHLDLTAALVGSFANGDTPALLAVSIGPVQDFIAAARSTSDLWAGSHLLSRLAWEAMRVVCEVCGPEAVIFPRLRGIPQVDLWLQQSMGLDAGLFKHRDWRTMASDANPLFAAALPNRFTAIVPAHAVEDIAARITGAVRAFARDRAIRALGKLLDKIGEPAASAEFAITQIDRQLAGFPEVHWSAVPWSLVGVDGAGKVDASDPRLAQAMQPFFEELSAPGFLGQEGWKLLSGGLEIDKGRFWKPNPGSLYPALHELLDRGLAAVKATRVFGSEEQTGWRCALTGETEWISLSADQLAVSYRKRTDTLWARVAASWPAWARTDEHLGALPMLKRLWPELFIEEIAPAVGLGEDIRRYVVSTHTMAMASALLAASDPAAGRRLSESFVAELDRSSAARVALPRKLSAALHRHPQGRHLRLLPGWLEASAESSPDKEESGLPQRRVADALGARADAYYGLLMLDGDQMGAWLSADPALTRPLSESFHPQVKQALEARFGRDTAFRRYADTRRAPNPAWHMAISEALNHFALLRAPRIVEQEHLGRLIYAGGDDVLAMLATSDLMAAAAALRAAYSGQDSSGAGAGAAQESLQGNGWALHEGRVLRMMGEQASASCGLVVAHHQAPLGSVMRELRAAEKRAKSEGGRDAWSLTLLKRSGGALQVTAKWSLLPLFDELRRFLGAGDVSRRAAYNVLDWVDDVPGDPALIGALLSYRMQRQSASQAAKKQAASLAARLVAGAFDDSARPDAQAGLGWLRDFMLAAEFMAREVRHGADAGLPVGEQR